MGEIEPVSTEFASEDQPLDTTAEPAGENFVESEIESEFTTADEETTQFEPETHPAPPRGTASSRKSTFEDFK